jgi:hypothetical protein
MPRPRRIRVRRPRDFKAEYARRQAKAKALGYENYYARRIRVGAPPSAPKPTGAELARVRGHRSAADLKKLLESGRAELLHVVRTSDAFDRLRIDALLQLNDGSSHEFTLDERRVQSVRAKVDRNGPQVVLLIGSPKTTQLFIWQRAGKWSWRRPK